MPTVASTSPAVLIAHLAAATRSIRIGSGGVMLPNHAPLAIAEQFALLEALHPGRIDLGIGRAPGTDPATASALRRSAHLEAVDDFPRDLVDLMGLLGDVRRENGMWRHFSATPSASSTPMIGLLGSSGYSAQLAGMLGLPFAFAHHFDTGGTLDALDLYREHFRPSADWPRPHVIVTAGVLAADTDAEAIASRRPRPPDALRDPIGPVPAAALARRRRTGIRTATTRGGCRRARSWARSHRDGGPRRPRRGHRRRRDHAQHDHPRPRRTTPQHGADRHGVGTRIKIVTGRDST